jgi:transcriptional regulator with XRE-family HTH domain
VKSTLLSRFGTRVREFRQKLAISQEELAARCELHRTYIGGIERGERNISLQNLFKIAEALETTASALLQGLKS